MKLKLKGFFVGVMSFIVLTIALVFIGNEFSISWLTLAYTHQNSESGIYVSIEPLMPVMIALLASLILEYVYVRHNSKKISNKGF
ncbi:hypothetical protein [Viridibacillus sp. FSL H8-0110]|uniref:hypothetical protein n=1 Tax=Viridibacillus sp. FSL H8-0110 TaxID=2921376 RepID=UPI0030FA55C5